MSSVTKESNPKDAIGSTKAPMHHVPSPIKFELGLAMMEGARKYGCHNYRAVGVRATVYYDAACRHLDQWIEGEDTDEYSGLPHLSKAMACLAIIRDSQLMGNWHDDRPPKLPGGLDMHRLNALAAKLVEMYPDCIDPFTELGEQEKSNRMRSDIPNKENVPKRDNPECGVDRCIDGTPTAKGARDKIRRAIEGGLLDGSIQEHEAFCSKGLHREKCTRVPKRGPCVEYTRNKCANCSKKLNCVLRRWPREEDRICIFYDKETT